MKKILMFGMSSYPGGIENCIRNYFINEKFAKEFSVVYCTYEKEIAYMDEIEGIGQKVEFLPHLKKRPLKYAKAIKKLLKAEKFDAVYVNMLSCANVLPIKYAKKYNVPIVCAHAHANSTVKGFLRKTLHKLNKKTVIKSSNFKLACSEQAGKWLFDDEKFTVVPNAINSELFKFDENNRKEIRNEIGANEKTFVIGHVGRIAEEKNHTFLLDVFKEILKDEPNSLLCLVGGGVLKDAVFKKAKEIGISDKVKFMGTRSDLYKIYPAFDAFAFPSVFEGFGMAVLEAQCSGIKCYCSDCLSPSLNVTGTVDFLPLSDCKIWAQKILENKGNKINEKELNGKVKNSDFNIDTQIEKLTELLNGR